MGLMFVRVWLLTNKTQTAKQIKCLFCLPEFLVFVYANVGNQREQNETKILSTQRQRHMWASATDWLLFVNGLNTINLIDIWNKIK